MLYSIKSYLYNFRKFGTKSGFSIYHDGKFVKNGAIVEADWLLTLQVVPLGGLNWPIYISDEGA